MDINKNVILLQNFIQKIPKTDNSLTNNMIGLKTPQNKVRVFINKSNKRIRTSPNKLTIEKYNNLSNSNYINIKNEKKVNKSLLLNKKESLNEITLNSLARENKLLKKEIEIVKSNLIISDEKEKLHKNTLQKIKKINKENEITYKNSINLINEYKKRENELINKINNLENECNLQEEKLEKINNELSMYKKDILNKNETISELNIKINDLNEQITKLKKIINQKNNIICAILKKNRNVIRVSGNSLKHIDSLTMSKSCNNIVSKKIDFKINKKDKNNNDYNSFKNKEEGNTNDILFYIDNNINNNIINNINKDFEKNENKNIKLIEKNSCYKKINHNKTHNNQNSLKLNSIKKNYSYNILNYNSLNYSIPKIKEININYINKKKTKSKHVFSFKNSFNKDILKTDRNNNDDIEEIYLNKNSLQISPKTKKIEKNLKRNNILEFNNYSFFLSDIGKSQPNKLIYINDEVAKNKKNNYSNTIANTLCNKKNKIENAKGINPKKNKLFEINKKFSSKSPSFISNLSLKNASPISPLLYKDLPK